MLFYLTLCVFSAMHMIDVNSLFLQESYNIQLVDNADYKIDVFVDENDYEMIKDNEIKQFHIDDKDNKLYELNKLARKEYQKNLKTRGPRKEWFKGIEPTVPIVTDTTVVLLTAYQTQRKRHMVKKRNAQNETTKDFPEYNYDYLFNEYYDESIEEVNSNHTFHANNITDDTKSDLISSMKKIVMFDTKTRNCTEEEIKQIGFKAVNCIYQDFKNHKESPNVLLKRLWRIIKIWFMVYLIIAVPLWCTRGWCCCCLFCKFFKPRRTIDAAKKYLVKNPPGVLTTSRGHQTEYKPTDFEIHIYDEFEHLIKTI